MTGVIMIVLIFLVGSLLGLLLGAVMSIRLVRQEVAGDLGPSIRQMQRQLSNIETELAYAVSSRYAEIHAQLSKDQRQQ
jgi:hypothetical protein